MWKKDEYINNNVKCGFANEFMECEYSELIKRVQGASDIQRSVVDCVLEEKNNKKVMWIHDFLKL